jgi:hypothetical protein
MEENKILLKSDDVRCKVFEDIQGDRLYYFLLFWVLVGHKFNWSPVKK